MNSDGYQSQPHRALNLLYAITLGHATIGDVAEELRQHGLDYSSLQFRKKTPQELVSGIVQRVPEIPFILNGKIYDPKDITRFNGQELYFVPAPNGGHMLVVDNQELFESWIRLAYQEVFGYRPMRQTVGVHPLWPGFIHYYNQHQHTAQPQPQQGGGVSYQPPLSGGGPPYGYGGGYGGGFGGGFVLQPGGGASAPEVKTYFYEHINTQGSRLDLSPNRGYWDLTKVRMGIFGDWNDEISSVLLRGTRVAVLHEHINMTGQKLTLFSDERDLHRLGWGDRASSVETW